MRQAFGEWVWKCAYFQTFPQSSKSSSMFSLAVCKIELDTVGKPNLLLDLHAFPPIFVFLFVCVCVFSAVSVISHRVHAVISILTISSILAHPCRDSLSPPQTPLSPGHGWLPTAHVDLTPSQEKKKQSLAEEVHPWKKMVNPEFMIWNIHEGFLICISKILIHSSHVKIPVTLTFYITKSKKP